MSLSNPSPSSRNIPEPMKREIRRRCGFGCVVCGLPLYEYEHLLGWANVQRHLAEEITLLCDRHHREKTGGLLPIDQVKAADSNPFNLQSGVSAVYDLHFSGTRCELNIGSNRAIADPLPDLAIMFALVIDGASLAHFRREDEHILLSLHLFDELNRLVLRVEDNELVYRVATWDIELVGKTLRLREAPRQLFAEIAIDPAASTVTISRGRFLLNGVELLLTPDYALVTNNAIQFSGNTMFNCGFGLVLGEMPQEVGCAVRIQGIPRYIGDRKAAKQWADANIKARAG